MEGLEGQKEPTDDENMGGSNMVNMPSTPSHHTLAKMRIDSSSVIPVRFTTSILLSQLMLNLGEPFDA